MTPGLRNIPSQTKSIKMVSKTNIEEKKRKIFRMFRQFILIL